MKIGELISAYRKEHGLSQRQFAKKCGGVSNGYISMLENDFNPATRKGITPTIEKLTSIASGMDMVLADLLEIVDDMPVDISGNEEKAETENEENYNDDDLWDLRETLRRRPEMRTLFSVSKSASKKDVEKAIAIIEALKNVEEN